MRKKTPHEKRLKLDKVADAPGFGFAEWTLDARDAFDAAVSETVGKMIAESIEIATRDYECFVRFSFEWGAAVGKGDDPTLVRVELPLGADMYDGPAWSFSLTDLVENALEMVTVRDKIVDGPTRLSSFVALRDALHGLADRIDRSIVKTEDAE